MIFHSSTSRRSPFEVQGPPGNAYMNVNAIAFGKKVVLFKLMLGTKIRASVKKKSKDGLTVCLSTQKLAS